MHLKILESSNFEEIFKYCNEKGYLNYINKFAIETLNLKKIQNFVLACEEELEKKTKLKSKPYKAIIDPTNACNLGCPLCPTGLGASSRTKKIMNFETFKKIIDEAHETFIEVHLYNWGEPTLNKHLINMLNYCKEKKIWTRISTNLSLEYKDGYLEQLLESGLSLLHVDLDGLDQEVYAKYRRKGDLNLVMKNLKKIKEIKSNKNLKLPIIELSMLAMRQNEHQHNQFLNMKSELGADEVKIDKIQHNPNMDEEWLPKNSNLIYKTYTGGTAPSNSAKENEKKQCHWPWSGIVINADGTINPCCIIDDPNADFDQISNKKLFDIWNSEEYISSRSEFSDQKEISKKTICNICKNQTHSKRLNRVSKSFAIKL
jgi:MoaA/NifB/PqqE/SkfB family radical SAM enzyme